ncbi:unnamed protein product [Sphenostylis stenocarpa]|uniref:Uncharacterized protein n=1 Tax=Sphenostylis stenocarpa TaxID=92480 RepID=A0AA86SDL3_9FABA|nr:unnamed protein product [Sphenostylis stenocarpa]
MSFCERKEDRCPVSHSSLRLVRKVLSFQRSPLALSFAQVERRPIRSLLSDTIRTLPEDKIPPGELFILDSPAGFRKRESGQMEVVLTFERRSTNSNYSCHLHWADKKRQLPSPSLVQSMARSFF